MKQPELELIQPDAVQLDLTAKNFTSALSEMVDFLLARKLIPSDTGSSILTALETREQQLSTNMGQGLAIPHASIRSLPGVVRLVAISPEGVIDAGKSGPPVRLFYLTLIPQENYSLHLRTIAAISGFFRQEGVIEQLLRANSEKEIQSLFQSA